MLQEKWFNCSSASQSSSLKTLLRDLKDLPHIHALTHFEKTRDDCHAIDRFFKDKNTILFLGTGGSSLGGKTLYDALYKKESKKLIFLDNVDPQTFFETLHALDLEKTGVVAISKSGNTSETLMQLAHVLVRYERFNLSPLEHMVIITEKRNNHAMGDIQRTYGIACFDHPNDIGGRFSCVSIVGLLPLVLMGLKAEDFLSGALSYYRHHLNDVASAVSHMHGFIEEGMGQSVMMPYRDRLNTFSFWYRQLWAESLGKKGIGSTPLNALGTVDQHSQLQLYLDGPRDKIYTLFYTHISDEQHGDPLILETSSHPSLLPLKNKTMETLLKAAFDATSQTLIEKNLPLRTLSFDQDTFHMGAFMMKMMLETICLGRLLDIDPFDQPAVERIKHLMYQNLS
jgi:glucose-6-phosphate isomerase